MYKIEMQLTLFNLLVTKICIIVEYFSSWTLHGTAYSVRAHCIGSTAFVICPIGFRRAVHRRNTCWKEKYD